MSIDMGRRIVTGAMAASQIKATLGIIAMLKGGY